VSAKLADQAVEGLLRGRLDRLYERVTGPWFVALVWIAPLPVRLL
jgi:hypothetical protein